MSDYSGHHAHEGLIGFDYTWRASVPGTLTTFARNNPHCILLFDEIENAHFTTMYLFLSLLDAGIVTDRYIETRKIAAENNALNDRDKPQLQEILNENPDISFKDAIIIFTSNAGSSLYEDDYKKSPIEISRKTLLNVLESEKSPCSKIPFFPSSIVSRIAIEYPILFNHLQPHHLEKIAEIEFEHCRNLFLRQYGIDVAVDKYVPISLLLREGGNIDARTLRAQTELFFKEQMYKIFSLQRTKNILPRLKSINFETELNKVSDEVDFRKFGKKYMQNVATKIAAEHKALSFDVKQKHARAEISATPDNFCLNCVPNADDIKGLIYDIEKPDVKFSDVIGAESAKDELRYFIKFLQNLKKFAAKGQNPPKGVLLHRHSDAGKTLLAKVMASESKAAFLSVAAAQFTSSGLVGAGSKAVSELFKKVCRYAPAIIFIDEIDAISRASGSFNTGHTEELALNSLLTEMDGFSSADPQRPVFVLAQQTLMLKKTNTAWAFSTPHLSADLTGKLKSHFPINPTEINIWTLC